MANCSAAAATVLAKAVPAIISQPVPSLVHSVCSADAAAVAREPSCGTFLGLFSLLPLFLTLYCHQILAFFLLGQSSCPAASAAALTNLATCTPFLTRFAAFLALLSLASL